MTSKQWLSVLCLLWSLPANAEFNAALLALNCLSCHQDRSGILTGDIPALSGLSVQQIRQDLLNFKYDRKPSTLMSRIAKGYSDDELRVVADYLAQH